MRGVTELVQIFRDGDIAFVDSSRTIYHLQAPPRSYARISLKKGYTATEYSLNTPEPLVFTNGTATTEASIGELLQVCGMAEALDRKLKGPKRLPKPSKPFNQILRKLWPSRTDEANLKAFYAGIDAGIEVRDETQALIEEIEYETLLNRALDTNDRELFAKLASLVPGN